MRLIIRGKVFRYQGSKVCDLAFFNLPWRRVADGTHSARRGLGDRWAFIARWLSAMLRRGAVAKLGGEQRRLSFSFPDDRCVWAFSGRLKDPVDDHRVRVRLPVRSNIVPCPFLNECIASIPFNVRYADLRFLNAPFGPRIRFNRPWSPSSTLLRYFTCRCSTVGGQIPSDFNSAVAFFVSADHSRVSG